MRFGEKVGCLPEKPPCLRKKFPIFLPPWGARANRSGLWVKQVAVIVSKIGALARGTGFLEREGDDEWRRIAAPWNKWWDGELLESGLIATLVERGRAKRGVSRFRRRRIALCTDENQRKKAASRVKRAFRLDWE